MGLAFLVLTKQDFLGAGDAPKLVIFVAVFWEISFFVPFKKKQSGVSCEKFNLD